MAAFPPPIPNEIFNTADFAAETGVLTIDTLKNYFLTYPIGQGTETIPALIVQGATNLQEDVSVGGDIYLTDTVGDGNNIYFQTADVTQASIAVEPAGNMTLTTVGDINITAPQINLTSSTITEIQTPNLDVYSPNAFTTYLQLLPTYAAGLADSATLYFGSTTQAANSYIGIDSLTSMAMAISSTGSIILNSAADMVQLTNAPSGTVDAAVATVGYVNSGYIPIGDGFPSGFIGQSVRVGVNALPSGWVYCNGASYPTNGIYANLFAVIGYSYGALVPMGQFYVPTIAGQFLISSDNAGTGILPSSNISNENSQTGGANTLNGYQLPAHTHNINYVVNKSAGGGSYGQIVPNGQTSAGEYGFPTTSAGSSATFSPPYFATNFMIKL